MILPQLGKRLSSQVRMFASGDHVFVKNFSGSPKWIPGKVMQRTGTTNYVVELSQGGLVHRHINQMIARRDGGDKVSLDDEECQILDTAINAPSAPQVSAAAESLDEDADQTKLDQQPPRAMVEGTIVTGDNPLMTEEQPPVLRSSVRIRRPPARFRDDSKPD